MLEVRNVTIHDTINQGTFNYLKYLKDGEMTLHEVTSEGTALAVVENPIDRTHYDIEPVVDGNDPNKATFKNSFKNGASYRRLALRFNTTIDWDAWQASEQGVTPVQPDLAYLRNNATVEYGGEKFKEVEAEKNCFTLRHLLRQNG